MQAFGMAIEMLIGLAGAPVFCFVLARFVRPFPTLAAWSFWLAVPLVVLFVLDLLLLITHGVLGTRTLVGPGFFLTHTVLALAIGPALACAALLGRRGLQRWWPLVAVVCWIAGATGLFYQHDAADTLYGTDGIGGPYQWPW